MKRITMRRVNNRLQQHGYELVKGCNYFYFHPLLNHPLLDDSMVMTCHLSSLTVDQWEQELLDKIKNSGF